jgi:hypothetical protein
MISRVLAATLASVPMISRSLSDNRHRGRKTSRQYEQNTTSPRTQAAFNRLVLRTDTARALVMEAFSMMGCERLYMVMMFKKILSPNAVISTSLPFLSATKKPRELIKSDPE